MCLANSIISQKVDTHKSSKLHLVISPEIGGNRHLFMTEGLKVSRLPRQMQRHQSDPVRRQASADIYKGPESATPATQIEPGVLKVPRLPRQMQRRQSRKCHACHTNRAVLKVSRLPRKMQRRQSDNFRGHL